VTLAVDTQGQGYIERPQPLDDKFFLRLEGFVYEGSMLGGRVSANSFPPASSLFFGPPGAVPPLPPGVVKKGFGPSQGPHRSNRSGTRNRGMPALGPNNLA